jgi:hypothetical protein
MISTVMWSFGGLLTFFALHYHQPAIFVLVWFVGMLGLMTWNEDAL